MWGMFYLAVLVSALFLYLPGYFLIRSIKVDRLVSLVCAPVVSMTVFGVLTLVYLKLSIPCSWVSLGVPTLVVGALACLVSSRMENKSANCLSLAPRESTAARNTAWRHLGWYAGVGLVVTSVIFLLCWSDPNAFAQEFDNVHHLGSTQAFLISGEWSPFSSSLYPTQHDALINPLPGSGFYPTAWNVAVALVVDSLGVSLPLGINAVNFLFIALVFPSNMFLVIAHVFRKMPHVVPFGALCVLGFVAFPWTFLTFGPLYPNMVAFCVLPSVLFCFMSIFSEGVTRASRIMAALLFCTGLVCFVFAQPNAVFTAMVFLIPFCAYQAMRLANYLPIEQAKLKWAKIGFAVVFLAAAAAFWFLLFKAPFLQSVVSHFWPATASAPHAAFNALFLVFRASAMQLLLAALVVAGGVYCLMKQEYRWLAFSYAFACCIFIAASGFDSGIKFLFSGFWYTDSFRVAAFASMFAMPLACVGLWLASRGLSVLIARLPLGIKERGSTLVGACVVAVVFLCVNFHPGVSLSEKGLTQSAFSDVAKTLSTSYSTEGLQVYAADEKAFVEEVKEKVPQDALIINEPNDGSVFAYSVNELGVYYRYLRTYGGDDETQESKLIRNHLFEIQSNAQVQTAVKSIGAQYVLLLDQGDTLARQPYLFTYEDGKDWKGIDQIQDGTPGFEVVLQRGDMRLYKIVA